MARKALTLTKPTKCACCGEMMNTGEAFRWHKGHRWVPDYSIRSSGTIRKIDTFKPAHTHDCYAAKVKAQLDQIAMDNIEAACVMAAKYGETAEWIAEYRAKLMDEADLPQ